MARKAEQEQLEQLAHKVPVDHRVKLDNKDLPVSRVPLDPRDQLELLDQVVQWVCQDLKELLA